MICTEGNSSNNDIGFVVRDAIDLNNCVKIYTLYRKIERLISPDAADRKV